MSEFSGDPAHPASPIRREQARQEGKTPKSYELASALHLLGAMAVATLLLGGIASWLKSWTIASWQSASENVTLDAAASTIQLQSTVFNVCLVLAPFLALMMILGVVAHWSQSGIMFRPQQVVPDLKRLSPSKWWAHVFSSSTFAIPFVGFPKTLLALGTALLSCSGLRDTIFSLGALPMDSFVSSLFGLVSKVGFQVALVLLALSLVDYLFKRWSFERQIRMTDQQMRDEMRMQNGDPTISAQRRQIHQSYSRRS